ncbi:MAG: putative toxin-antitoxin system toxin component, PIN family [Chlorobi bacterium]|nr:putative toxin-antitoxin system toxin component, PIN family [Chlorobiota bacterium]
MQAKKRIRIIIDTNLFISFLIGKRLGKLKEYLVNSGVALILSEQNILEIKLVTTRPKFRRYFSKNDV